MSKKRTKKKQPAAKDSVKLKLLALCDSVSRDPNTNKLTLYGLFDEFLITKGEDKVPKGVNKVLQPFALVVRLDGTGKHRITLKVSDQDQNDFGTPGNRPILNVDLVSGQTTDAIFNLSQMPATKTGFFTFTVMAERKKLGTITAKLNIKNK